MAQTPRHDHYPECRARTAGRAAAIRAWQWAYPHHCRKCRGWGGRWGRREIGGPEPA